MNAQKFTQKSLEAIQEAQNIAIENNNMQIEQEHLVSALLSQENGLIPQMLKKMGPLMSFLFPSLPAGHPARKHMAVNMIANFLGLGWAATPAGLQAMESLGKLEEERRAGKAPGPARKKGIAGNEMCTFLILNISSLQLIPVNIIAYRTQYGSTDPTAIVGPAILATAVSTGVAVVFCKIMDRRHVTQ